MQTYYDVCDMSDFHQLIDVELHIEQQQNSKMPQMPRLPQMPRVPR